jgi:hypothetical protein
MDNTTVATTIESLAGSIGSFDREGQIHIIDAIKSLSSAMAHGTKIRRKRRKNRVETRGRKRKAKATE